MVGYFDDLQGTLVTVMDGVVQGERKMERDEHHELRKSQFEAYQETPEYRRLVQELRSEYRSENEDALVRMTYESAYPRYMTARVPESPGKRESQ